MQLSSETLARILWYPPNSFWWKVERHNLFFFGVALGACVCGWHHLLENHRITGGRASQSSGSVYRLTEVKSVSAKLAIELPQTEITRTSVRVRGIVGGTRGLIITVPRSEARLSILLDFLGTYDCPK